MIKCKKCGSNEVKVKLIDNYSNKREKQFVCKICDFTESIIFNIQKSRKVEENNFSYFKGVI